MSSLRVCLVVGASLLMPAPLAADFVTNSGKAAGIDDRRDALGDGLSFRSTEELLGRSTVWPDRESRDGTTPRIYHEAFNGFASPVSDDNARGPGRTVVAKESSTIALLSVAGAILVIAVLLRHLAARRRGPGDPSGVTAR